MIVIGCVCVYLHWQMDSGNMYSRQRRQVIYTVRFVSTNVNYYMLK